MTFLSTLKQETKRIFTDVTIVLTIIGGVIFYSFLYPQPYLKQSVSKLDISVVDYDKSDVSRDIVFSLNATAQISVAREDFSEEDAKKSLLSDEVKAIIVIPKNFKRDLALNKSPTIAIGADSSYFLIYGGVLEGAMKSILTKSATIKVANLLKEQVPLGRAKESYSAYSLNIINLFNKNNSYTQYVIPAIFVLILQQTLLIGLGIFGGGINESMKNKEEGYFNTAPILYMFTSRVLIFGSIFLLHLLFYFGYSFELFGVTHLANMYELLTFSMAFLMATLGLGILLGTLFNSREVATPAVLFSSLPLAFSAGFIWPVEEVPEIIRFLTMFAPVTPAIDGFLALNQFGAEFYMVMDSYALLWLQAISYFTLAYFLFRQKRKKLSAITQFNMLK